MPDELQTLPIEPSPDASRPRRRRRFTFGTRGYDEQGVPLPRSPEEVVTTLLEQVTNAQDERSTWMDQRLERYAKLRGWIEARENGPWDDCSNQHIPVMMANSLRIKAGLFNAVLGMRPVMQGKPLRHEHKELAETIDSLLDHQIFTEAKGEQAIEQIIDRFVDDGTALTFVPYIRDTQRVVDVRVVPKETDQPFEVAIPQAIQKFVPDLSSLTMKDDAGYSWTGEVPDPRPEEPPIEVSIEVYDRDDRSWELVLSWRATTFDGPVPLPQALEDIVVPMRCENCQPCTPENPTGAPWVAHLAKVSLDTIRDRIQNGTYDYLEMKDFEETRAEARPRADVAIDATQEDALKREKDAKEGRDPGWSDDRDQITVVTWYGRWDVNGDGQTEEVIFTVLQEPQQLARARYLTEQYPGLPLHRPFAEARFIPVPDQFYGIGLPELSEGMHDFLHTLINQMLDNGDLTNTPFGFYRASSGMKPEPIRIPGPGVLFPTDNPQQDIAFPNLPHADQSFGFNMVGLGMQFMERLVQIGSLQFGQVPQGKASALRTVGTTMAILQQGAAMPEQILRRLFMGLKDIWTQCHLLNIKHLPPGKRFLLTGKPQNTPEAYGVINDPGQLAIPLAFDFQATLLNTNKGIVSQALTSLGMALFNPLALQFGTVDAEKFYNWQRDLVQANQLDPARYLNRPPMAPTGETPRLTAPEVLLWIVERMQVPPVAPVEPPEQHLQALMGLFQQPENQVLLGGDGGLLLREYFRALTALIQQQQQAQMMAQAAQEFGAMIGNEGQGQQASMGMPPEPQAEAPDMREVQGAGTQGPPGSAS